MPRANQVWTVPSRTDRVCMSANGDPDVDYCSALWASRTAVGMEVAQADRNPTIVVTPESLREWCVNVIAMLDQ
jgi:hypothetical protein